MRPCNYLYTSSTLIITTLFIATRMALHHRDSSHRLYYSGTTNWRMGVKDHIHEEFSSACAMHPTPLFPCLHLHSSNQRMPACLAHTYIKNKPNKSILIKMGTGDTFEAKFNDPGRISTCKLISCSHLRCNAMNRPPLCFRILSTKVCPISWIAFVNRNAWKMMTNLLLKFKQPDKTSQTYLIVLDFVELISWKS